jgi:predicted glutamine amidotransferase
MARLFGLIGNRADLAGRVLGSESDALRVRARSGSQLGWGIGFYQGGEVLMRRRPIDGDEIDVAKLASDVRADVLIGHVRTATIGTLRTENTHPFRYRQWLFAKTGTLSQFDAIRERLVQSVPEFLRGGIRGETDSEIFFHVYLSFLHDAGRLNDLLVEPQVVCEALRSSLAVVDGMTAEVGGEPGDVNILVTNGDCVIGLHRGRSMAYRVFSGKNDADQIIGEDLQLRRKTPELAQMHFSLVASDFDADAPSLSMSVEAPPATRWKYVSDRAIVTLTRGTDPQIEAL